MKPRNTRRRLITVDRLGVEHDDEQDINCSHVVLKVTTKAGNSYALDITGAQYGYYEIVVPWNLYVNSRVEKVKESWPFGEWEGDFLAEKFLEEGSAHGALKELNKHRTLCMNSALVDWQKDNMPLSAILKLPEDAFQLKQSELISFVKGSLPKDQHLEKLYLSVPRGRKETKAMKVTTGTVQTYYLV